MRKIVCCGFCSVGCARAICHPTGSQMDDSARHLDQRARASYLLVMSRIAERIASKGAAKAALAEDPPTSTLPPRTRPVRKLPDLDDPSIRRVILDEIASGSPLSKAARAVGFPDAKEVWRRMQRDDGWAAAVARASEQREGVRAEECIEIADAAARAKTAVEVQAANLRVNTRLKLMPLMAPARFAAFQRVEHSGPNGGPIEFANLSGDQLDQITRQLKARLDALEGASPMIDITPEDVSNE